MGGEGKGEGGEGGQQRREGVGGRELGKDGSFVAEEILHKRVGWPKSGGLGKKYFKGGPGQKGVNQILRGGGGGGGCDLG